MAVTKNANDRTWTETREPGQEGKDLSSAVADKAHDVTKAIGDKATDAARFVGDKADAAAGKVGSGLESLASKVRDNAPHEGMLGKAADKVAEGIEKTGHYLKEEGMTGMGQDMLDLVKRYPVPALAVGMCLGVGMGYLMARATGR